MSRAARPELERIPSLARPARLLASIDLDFRFDRHVARTVLASSLQQPPLQVVRAFAQPDGAALVHLHNVSGGILGGDQLSVAVRLAPGARVQITTTGATRVYRPRADADAARQLNQISVGEDALLEYVPDAIIPFAGVRFAQRTTIRLDHGAGLFWWEIVAPGREARGELFAYDHLEMSTDITAGGCLIASERVRLDPRHRSLSSSARLGPHRTWATFYICRAGVPPGVWLDLENHLRDVAAEYSCSGAALWGVSTLLAHGLTVRCVAAHSRDVLAGLRALWRAAKLRLYATEPILPRKVN